MSFSNDPAPPSAPEAAYIVNSPITSAASQRRKIQIVRERLYTSMDSYSTTNRSLSGDAVANHFRAQALEYGQDVGCVFLLWGSSVPTTKAVEVLVKGVGKGNISEHEIFLGLGENFGRHTSPWARYLKLRTVCSVKPVKFRFIKCQNSGFLVSLLGLNFLDARDTYQARFDELDKQFNGYTNPEDFCFPDLDNNGKYHHTHQACGFVDHRLSLEPWCPFEEYDKLKSNLNWFDTLTFLKYYFLYPEAAKGQIILSKSISENFIYRHSFSSITFASEKERRFETLNGLYVEERWRHSTAIPMIVATLIITIVVSRAIWKSWEVVFGATGCLVAAMSLVYALHDS